ncbi:hypothetical protein DASC09_044410 [Saccharomycopsis crataegensis]|uniref:Uncharacterized protein n=1 Tax=Saccharomycopsis crataegensis TaxID=43959 RepID=A0AAV5QRE5_9ASCO|nr:hypothetical protein DASC09_044410 [Saccharomycopsis crataegensis]
MSYRSSYRSGHGGASSGATSRKSHSEKNQQILKALAKQAANKNCADCKVATNPRWASWNIGVFVCIRCSGIHRSMGTHISKVKSIDLDSWTDDQVQSMVAWGNEKANVYWEHNLPDNHVPDDSKIQNFIRTKYELKKWVATKYLPDPKTINTSSSSTESANTNILPDSSAPKSVSAPSNGNGIDLLGGFELSTTSAPSSSANSKDLNDKPLPKPSAPAAASTGGLLDLNFSSPSNTGIPSSTGATAATVNSTQQSGRQDLKKSILALYSTPSNYNKPAVAPSPVSRNLYSQPQQQQQQPSSSFGGLSNSLASLNLSSNTSAASSSSTSTGINTNFDYSSSNVWSSAPTLMNGSNNTASATKKSALDDDLFKNVWS